MNTLSVNSEGMKQSTDRLVGSADRKGIAARLMEIARETAPLMNDGRTSKEMMDDLFDEETGLPK
jgi:hypothetical protein